MLIFASTIVSVVFAANASGLWIAVLAIALASWCIAQPVTGLSGVHVMVNRYE